MMNRSIRFFTLIVLCNLPSALHADAFDNLRCAYSHPGKLAAVGCLGAYAIYQLRKKVRKHAPLFISGAAACYVAYKCSHDEELKQLTINGFTEVLKGINQLRADIANGFVRVESQLDEICRTMDIQNQKLDRNSQQIARTEHMMEIFLKDRGLQNEIPDPVASEMPNLNTIPITPHAANIQPDKVNIQTSGGYVNWVTQNSPTALTRFINRFR